MINRVDRRSQLECLKQCGELLKRGASVLFFPEGTRSKDGRMHGFKKGAFSVAAKAKERLGFSLCFQAQAHASSLGCNCGPQAGGHGFAACILAARLPMPAACCACSPYCGSVRSACAAF
jgi:hypothetical protein